LLWAVQNGYVDQVPVERIKEFQNKLTEFLTLRKEGLLQKIAREKTLSDGLVAELKDATNAFQETWK